MIAFTLELLGGDNVGWMIIYAHYGSPDMRDTCQDFFVCLAICSVRIVQTVTRVSNSQIRDRWKYSTGSSSCCTAHSAGSNYNSRKVNVSKTNNVDPLVVSKVIGDVVDPFVPTVNMSVNYGSKHVSDGIELKPSMTGNRPTVHIGGHEKDMYTLVFTDPDVPGPDNPFDREFLHWVVVNIPGGTEPHQGEEVVTYVRPTPPIGIHRDVFVLFKQKTKFPPKAVAMPERVKFKTRCFADKHKLGLPVAVEYFTAQKESQ